jgi:hypothetical protein
MRVGLNAVGDKEVNSKPNYCGKINRTHEEDLRPYVEMYSELETKELQLPTAMFLRRKQGERAG